MHNKLVIVCMLMLGTWSVKLSAQTLDLIKKRGELVCGVTVNEIGFASSNEKGEWQGFDVDFCRAVAVAVLGDKSKVKIVPTSSKDRFSLLASGQVDLLSRNTTWNFTRDVELKNTFIGAMFYDGQGFMVPKDSKISKVKDLDGATICVQSGTTTEVNLADYFKNTGLKYTPVLSDSGPEIIKIYQAGRCDAYTTDRSQLYGQLASIGNGKHKVLDELISKEPLSPLVKEGDDHFADVVRWTYYTLISAEELGLSQANVEEKSKTAVGDAARLLGKAEDFGGKLGLAKDFAYQIIKQLGSYADIFDRNLGVNTPLKIERGLNKLWNQGGLLYSPPLR